MTILEEIENLTWYNLVNKLKSVLKRLLNNNSESPYYTYHSLLSQSNEDAPTDIILENTLGGNVVWSYDQDGQYFAELPITITEDNISVILGNQSVPVIYNAGYNSSTSIYLQTYVNTEGATWTLTNNFLSKTPIEIKIKK